MAVPGKNLESASAPLPDTYWVEPGRLLAGSYPGRRDPELTEQRISTLLAAGVDYFVDLTWPDELPSYEEWLPSPYAAGPRRAVSYSRRPIVDHDLPRTPAEMVEILDEIEQAMARGYCVYVHCRAGIGRTGTVVGCLLTRSGIDGEAALIQLAKLWNDSGRVQEWPCTPETSEQIDYVINWRESVRALPVERGEGASLAVADTLQDRYRGWLFGMALGDALGAAVQHRRRGSFAPLRDLLGGGPFDLPPGAWTDDTALSLCLADSLLAGNGFDGNDQIARYLRWQREGYLSSTGQCLGISAATAKALAAAVWSGNPFSGSHDPARADKEPLVRAGVVAAWRMSDPAAAIELAAEAARTTHQAPVTLDACRYFAALVVGALQGRSKEELLSPLFAPVAGLWTTRRLKREVEVVAAGGWRKLEPPQIHGGGSAVDALAATLWSLERGSGFRESVLLGVNLGQDADTTGALVGQLAGAIAGAGMIPPAWRAQTARRELLQDTADRLLSAALAHAANA